MWQYNEVRYEGTKCFLAGLSAGVGGHGQVVQQRVYVGHDLAGVQGLVVAPHRLAAVVQQELLKVPPGDGGLWLHDSEPNLQSVASSPDIVLMVGIIIQVVGGPELLPDGRASALEKCVDGILVLAIHLQKITCAMWKKLNLLSILTSVLANISKLGTNPWPGLTCFSEANISLALAPGSWIFLRIRIDIFICTSISVSLTCLRNWLQGKPIILKGLSAYRSVSALRERYWGIMYQGII